jgi:hypothetical protein
MVVDLARWVPPRRIVNLPDGDTQVERLPSVRSAKMMNRAGHVVYVSLRNGMGNNGIENDAYGNQILAEKQRKGMVLWGKCLVVHPYPDHMPEDMRGKSQCRAGKDGGPITGDNPCACMIELQARRRKIHEKREAEVAARYTSPSDRERSVLGGAVEALSKLVEGQSKPRPGKRDD